MPTYCFTLRNKTAEDPVSTGNYRTSSTQWWDDNFSSSDSVWGFNLSHICYILQSKFLIFPIDLSSNRLLYNSTFVRYLCWLYCLACIMDCSCYPCCYQSVDLCQNLKILFCQLLIILATEEKKIQSTPFLAKLLPCPNAIHECIYVYFIINSHVIYFVLFRQTGIVEIQIISILSQNNKGNSYFFFPLRTVFQLALKKGQFKFHKP